MKPLDSHIYHENVAFNIFMFCVFVSFFQTREVCTCSDNFELLFCLPFSFMEIDNCRKR